jgi:hypothetical protein
MEEKEGRYERGEDVPLEQLPEELQENVRNPPPSVKRLRKKMIEKMASLPLTQDGKNLYRWVATEYNRQPVSRKSLEKAIREKRALNGGDPFISLVSSLGKKLPSGIKIQNVQRSFLKGSRGKGFVRFEFKTGIPMLNVHLDASDPSAVKVRYEVNNKMDRSMVTPPASQTLDLRRVISEVLKSVKGYMKGNSSYERGFLTPPRHPKQIRKTF